jgi:hypothetical protein
MGAGTLVRESASPALPTRAQESRRPNPSTRTAVLFYLLLCAVTLACILALTHGHLVFSLDDPCIHFALARHIAHGHYGINAAEPASPSSSILWPFLLALAPSAAMPWAALALNLAAGITAAWVLGRVADDFAPNADPTLRLGITLTLVLVANLSGLTFTGMEHTLQVLLAALCGWGLAQSLRTGTIPRGCLVAAALAPLIRYEDLTLTLAVGLALCAARQRAAALKLALAALTPLVLFSLFLHTRGLPWLPLSVLIKGGITPQAGASTLSPVLHTLRSTAVQTVTSPDRLALLFLFLALCVAAWRMPRAQPRLTIAAAALAVALHLLIGRFGWFHRYEIYITVFAAIVLLAALRERPFPHLNAISLAALAILALPSLNILTETPLAARSIYLQQFQMGRFMHSLYAGNVAVNDLGWVSYRSRPGTYVLDMMGLGSLETAQQKNKTAAWADALARDHHITLVLMYVDWLPAMPADWTELGDLRIDVATASIAEPCVAFYATPLANSGDTAPALTRFAQSLPAGVSWTAPGTCARMKLASAAP